MNANQRALQIQSSKQPRTLSARLEPFDSYWQAPKDAEKGFASFAAYYRSNYLPWMPRNLAAPILVISCGPGYLLKVLRDSGYSAVLGIDSDPAKIAIARQQHLRHKVAPAFAFVGDN